eukprot:COSAG02_NODE_19160_length_897_cov_0.858396_1_plen_41_part_10
MRYCSARDFRAFVAFLLAMPESAGAGAGAGTGAGGRGRAGA